MKSEFILSELDYQILESYRQIIHGLGEYLGSAYEIILHNLGSYDHSVIAIENGHYTGRKVGAPITNMALDMLESIRNNNSGDNISYFTTNRIVFFFFRNNFSIFIFIERFYHECNFARTNT